MINKVIILKVGGSLLSPSSTNLFDWVYAQELSAFLIGLTEEGYSIFLSVGGGKLTRNYQNKIQEIGVSDLGADKVGIAITNLHAEIMQSLLQEKVAGEVIRYDDYKDIISGTREVDIKEGEIQVISAGIPGHSNDWNALQLAIRLGKSIIYSMKNVDGVYTSDPKHNSDAVLLPKLSWVEYLEIIGNPVEQLPGGSYPVSPIAAREAHENDVEFIIVGKDLENMRSLINGDEYQGSLIQ